MKPSLLPRFSRSLILNSVVIVVTVFADHVVAANVTWDLLSAGANNGTITGGAGAWDAATTNWSTDGGVTNVAWSNAGNDTAVFAGTAGTVTLGAPITAGGLTFNSTSYIVTGAQTLTLAGATPTINVGSGLTSTIGSAVLFVIGGTSGLTKSGGGTLTLTSSAVSTYTGSTAVNGGQLSLSFATATPNNLVPSGSALSLNGGAISMLLASGLTKSQTF